MLCCCLQFIKGDLQSGDLLSYILETEKIDTVMHFAAQVRLLCPGRTWLTGLFWLGHIGCQDSSHNRRHPCQQQGTHCASGGLKQARQTCLQCVMHAPR